MAVKKQQIASRAFSVSKLGLESRDQLSCAKKKVPETLVSEIVSPSAEAAELLSGSAPLAAAAPRVRVDPSSDVVMTPVDQTQQSEDANLRKIGAQFHVNLGHRSNDALARAIRLSGGCNDASRSRSRFGALSVND